MNSLNTLYLVFNDLDGYFEKSGEKRYLIFASTEKNKVMLKNYIELWDEIKEQIELITGDKVIKYSNDFIKIRFKTNDDLPLNKIINILECAVIVSRFSKKIMNITHKFCYMIVFMSMKKILILELCKVLS